MANFITEQEVKNTTQISGVTDGMLIAPFIITGQDKFLRQFLGEAFYTDLKGNLGSLSSPEQALVDDYIKPYLSWIVLSEALPRIRTRVHNGGVFQRSSQDTAPIDTKAFEREMAWAMETAISYQNIMERYLNDNASLYPLWKKCQSDKQQGVIIIA
jgi:hypothetical protein